jgi:hypothetical protein
VLSHQSWLWAAPAKHSPRQFEELLEHIESCMNSVSIAIWSMCPMIYCGIMRGAWRTDHRLRVA